MTLNKIQQEMDREEIVYFRRPAGPRKNAYITDMYWGFKNKKRVTMGDGIFSDINRKRRYFDTLEEAVKYLEENGYIYENPWK